MNASMTWTMLSLALVVVVVVVVGLSSFPARAATNGSSDGAQITSQWSVPELHDKTYKHWLDFIRPSAQETKWKKVGWRPSLWEAIQEARELQQPVLLWTMNGHPLSDT